MALSYNLWSCINYFRLVGKMSGQQSRPNNNQCQIPGGSGTLGLCSGIRGRFQQLGTDVRQASQNNPERNPRRFEANHVVGSILTAARLLVQL